MLDVALIDDPAAATTRGVLALKSDNTTPAPKEA
jgi:hypothetical protein